MRNIRTLAAGIVVIASANGPAFAQIASVPGATGIPGGASAIPSAAGAAPTTLGAPAAAPSAPTRNLWSMLLPSQAQCDKCKTKLCSSGIGKLMNSMLMPVSGLTGGTFGNLCPGPNAVNPADLAQPADSAEGAAARIKQQEADAKARIAAIMYRSTVDCRYFPEATAALINGLRADTNECVRIAAAKALLVGCCCNKPVITALTRSVNGDDKDGNPGERSECVRAYAYLALQRCLACYTEPPPKQPEAGEAAPAPKEKEKSAMTDVRDPIQLAAFSVRAKQEAGNDWLAEARTTVARGMNISKETLWRIGGQQTLVGVVTGKPSALTLSNAPPTPPSPAQAVGTNAIPTPMPSAMPTPTPSQATQTTPPPTGRRNLFSLWQQAIRPASATQPGS